MVRVIGSGLKNGSFILNSNGVFGYRTATGHCGIGGLEQD